MGGAVDGLAVTASSHGESQATDLEVRKNFVISHLCDVYFKFFLCRLLNPTYFCVVCVIVATI